MLGDAEEEPAIVDAVTRLELSANLKEAAMLLAQFVGEEVSYMFVESRGVLHFATPSNRMLQKIVFQDWQHNEAGSDCGSASYGRIFDEWVKVMGERFAGIAVPVHASKKNENCRVL